MRKRAIGRWVLIGFSFVWLAFVYASFYLVQQQRPFGGENLQAVVSTFLDLVTAGALTLVSAGFGWQVCHWMGVSFAGNEGLIWSTGIGLGVFGLVVLVAGVLGGVTRWTFVLLLCAMAVLSWSGFRAIARSIVALRSVVRPRRGLGIYLASMLLLTLLVALSPPLDWDGLFYHLTVPRLYIEQGRIAPVTDIPHQYFPGLMEMLYLAAMALKGDVAAKLLHFVYLLLLGGGIYVLSQRHLGAGYGWQAVAAYASIPMVFVLGSWAYNDLALAFYQVASLYALLNWFRNRGGAWLLLSALFCGLAMGLKYTSFVCPVAGLLFTCWHMARARAHWSAWIRALAIFCCVALIVAAPWYVFNLAFTGNPVYPFAYGIFGGRDWDGWRAAWYARAGTGIGWDLGALLRLPWTLTLGVNDRNFYDGRVGPLILLSLPFLLAWFLRLFGRSKARPQAVGYLATWALLQYVVWVLGVVNSHSLFQSRLLLPAFAALCVPVAYVYKELRVLDTRVVSLRRLFGMSIALVFAANLCYQGLYTMRIRPLPVLVGQEPREAFLARNLGAHYEAMSMVNGRVSESGRVLFLWEPRSYYCLRPAQPDPILERWAWLRHQHGDDLDRMADALWQGGYTHLLLYRDGLERARQIGVDALDDAQVTALETFLDRYWDEAASVGNAYQLYRSRPIAE
jgi:hypothetical protein